jgi:uncharacterized protein (DUF934 family)
MATIIRNGRICNENWRLLDAACALPDALTPATGDGVLVPLTLWRAARERATAASHSLGVVLNATDDLDLIADDLHQIEVVAVHFARFSDGRGYSIARLLRGRHGYRGELRAVGDVLRDQLFYMQRVGFDAFELRADQDPAAAMSALRDFTESYQGAVEPVLPLFRRRAA